MSYYNCYVMVLWFCVGIFIMFGKDYLENLFVIILCLVLGVIKLRSMNYEQKGG